VLVWGRSDPSEFERTQQVNTDNTTADLYKINTMSNLQAYPD